MTDQARYDDLQRRIAEQEVRVYQQERRMAEMAESALSTTLEEELLLDAMRSALRTLRVTLRARQGSYGPTKRSDR